MIGRLNFKLIILLLYLTGIVSCAVAQQPQSTDTIYVLFQEDKDVMMKSRGYRIFNEIDTLRDWWYTIHPTHPDNTTYFYTFRHYEVPEEFLLQGIGTKLISFDRDTSFLATISPLTYEWFEQHNAGYIDTYFGRYSRNQPVIFIIDKADLKEGKLTLIQVVYHGPPARE